jgi:hypothetical protein
MALLHRHKETMINTKATEIAMADWCKIENAAASSATIN